MALPRLIHFIITGTAVLLGAPALQDQTLFDAIVQQGILSDKGMASFKDYLKQGDTAALRAYLISLAEAALAQLPAQAPAAR